MADAKFLQELKRQTFTLSGVFEVLSAINQSAPAETRAFASLVVSKATGKNPPSELQFRFALARQRESSQRLRAELYANYLFAYHSTVLQAMVDTPQKKAHAHLVALATAPRAIRVHRRRMKNAGEFPLAPWLREQAERLKRSGFGPLTPAAFKRDMEAKFEKDRGFRALVVADLEGTGPRMNREGIEELESFVRQHWEKPQRTTK